MPVVPAVPARFVLPMNVDSEALIGFVAVPLSLPCTCVPIAVVSMYDGSPMALDLLPFTSLPVPIEMDCSPSALAPAPIATVRLLRACAPLPIATPISAFSALAPTPITILALLSFASPPLPITSASPELVILFPVPNESAVLESNNLFFVPIAIPPSRVPVTLADLVMLLSRPIVIDLIESVIVLLRPIAIESILLLSIVDDSPIVIL